SPPVSRRRVLLPDWSVKLNSAAKLQRSGRGSFRSCACGAGAALAGRSTAGWMAGGMGGLFTTSCARSRVGAATRSITPAMTWTATCIDEAQSCRTREMSKIHRQDDAGQMIDDSEFRRVMGHFPTGVTVVTSLHQDGRPCG